MAADTPHHLGKVAFFLTTRQQKRLEKTLRRDEVLYPHGYKRWVCDWCTASCNFEAMNWCHMTSGGIPCPFDRDQPESLDGAFEFMVKEEPNG